MTTTAGKPPELDDLWDSWTEIPDYEGDEGPYWFGVYPDVECAACGHRWVAVAPVGSRGKECPECGFYDPDVLWGIDG